MGFKKFFGIRPPEEDTPERNRDLLTEEGIATKNPNSFRKEKFAAYGKFAAANAQDHVYAPAGYEQYARPGAGADKDELESLNRAATDAGDIGNTSRVGQPQQRDPYAVNDNYNPYANGTARDPYATAQPYARQAPVRQAGPRHAAGTPYGSAAVPQGGPGNPYGGSTAGAGTGRNPYQKNMNATVYPPAAGKTANPYASMAQDPYGKGEQRGIAGGPVAMPVPMQPRPQAAAETPRPQAAAEKRAPAVDVDDLNAVIEPTNEDDDLNNSIHEGNEGLNGQGQAPRRGFQTFEELQREQEMKQQMEEDEEVDEIKQQIRFTKQSSVASTRNTLKMAQDAELAGMNSLGMLGHQSEKLNNVERNLNLMKVQNRVAEDKVAELKRLNRNILAVHVGNPFTSKRKVREAEERIKNQRMQDKMQQEETTTQLMSSTNRIENALNDERHSVRERYQRDQALERAKKYQFENDEEDDEMEFEIDRNLDKIGQVSGRLKKLAIAAGQEIDSQQSRIKRIEEDADDMDIRIHLNTSRLTNIR
ncbi:AFR469Wp [Eremothecium gossypii ATCC 10895]|uniref:Protein transport protein SEC9 n=1 Tax=Eremothecium gossypii (strain ATCC 10895 / CBS 109.51 / FGSC 9923 / NRRL Y-1056) TaxID=284811 RepID=SEC9_EREGS|nr:AFR469Wp [Eremothecium gossypii ATCC 10895]Q752V4.1 RecName: Full=Protein transport protein SEC9 [Eremothecium gossypii ATCC 10895]AAS53840.1 AFR469Wp [Eremothecium gossypii ATCC 10895]AEY98153.1 FAFR469Wp [Eremothecium gossypii FDAG1]